MKNKLMTRIGLLAVSIVLAAMGCWFCQGDRREGRCGSWRDACCGRGYGNGASVFAEVVRKLKKGE